MSSLRPSEPHEHAGRVSLYRAGQRGLVEFAEFDHPSVVVLEGFAGNAVERGHEAHVVVAVLDDVEIDKYHDYPNTYK